MRSRNIDRFLVHGGTVLIFFVMVLLAYKTPGGIDGSALWIVLGGVGLASHTAGVFNTIGRTFAARKFLKLREELDQFIGMVRHLNAYAVDQDDANLGRIQSTMHRSVDKMAKVAGIAEGAEEPIRLAAVQPTATQRD